MGRKLSSDPRPQCDGYRLIPASCSPTGERMRLFHGLFEPLIRNMGLDLSGRDIGVAKQRLHASQVGTALHKMCGKRMPKDMGR